MLATGLLVALGAFFTGPSVTATTTRRAFVAGFGWVRRRGELVGVRTGPVGTWVYAQRKLLRIAASLSSPTVEAADHGVPRPR